MTTPQSSASEPGSNARFGSPSDPYSQPPAGYPPPPGYPPQQGYPPPQPGYSPPQPSYPPPQGYPAAAGYPSAPGPGYYGVDAYGNPLSDKSKITAGLLGIFLGGFGVGRFYLGYTGIGVAQLVVSIVTLGFGALWGFIDGILIIAGNVPDAQGRTLRQ